MASSRLTLPLGLLLLCSCALAAKKPHVLFIVIDDVSQILTRCDMGSLPSCCPKLTQTWWEWPFSAGISLDAIWAHSRLVAQNTRKLGGNGPSRWESQLGFDDVGFRSHQIRTPTIDALAKDGWVQIQQYL